MGPFKLLIDGKLVDGDSTMSVLNPANEEVLAQCPRASKAQLVVVIAERNALIAQMHKDIEAMRMRVSIAERNAPKPAYVRAPYQRPMRS